MSIYLQIFSTEPNIPLQREWHHVMALHLHHETTVSLYLCRFTTYLLYVVGNMPYKWQGVLESQSMCGKQRQKKNHSKYVQTRRVTFVCVQSTRMQYNFTTQVFYCVTIRFRRRTYKVIISNKSNLRVGYIHLNWIDWNIYNTKFMRTQRTKCTQTVSY